MAANRRRVDRVPGERRRSAARALRLAAPSLLALALLGGGAALAHRALFASAWLRVQEVRFHGLARLRPEALESAIPVRRGDALLRVDPGAVEAALSKVGWIASAEVRRRFGEGVVEIDVQERRAAALVMMGDLYLVDDRGEVFERALPGAGLDLPVVTGVERSTYLERRAEMSQVLAGAVALVHGWSKAKLDARMPISEIHVDPVFGTTVVSGDGTELRLGMGELDAKLSRLARLLPALAAEPRKAEVIHLDDRRHPERVTVRFAGELELPTTASAGVGAPAKQGEGRSPRVMVGPVASARPETAGRR